MTIITTGTVATTVTEQQCPRRHQESRRAFRESSDDTSKAHTCNHSVAQCEKATIPLLGSAGCSRALGSQIWSQDIVISTPRSLRTGH